MLPWISLLRGRDKAGTLFEMGAAFIILVVWVSGLALLALFAVGKYNCLVSLRNRYKNAFSGIAIQLQRRCDVIGNLVAIAGGSLKHEHQTWEAVISAINSAQSATMKAAANPGEAKSIKELSAAEKELRLTLKQFFAVAETYSDLMARHDLLQLSEELTVIEKEISTAQQTYNDAVIAYNTRRESFPDRIVAKAFSFAAAELFVPNDAPEATLRATFI